MPVGDDTYGMRSYGQYCPIARAAEIFAERWTPIIVRNVLLGCRTFTEIHRGAPGLSRTLLTQRLRELERVGVIERQPAPDGRGSIYVPTPAGQDLWEVCMALGTWGARWLEVAPAHLDPYVVLWSMCNSLDVSRLPEGRVVVRFEFTDLARNNRFWLLIEHGAGEVCISNPGIDEDLVIRADSETFALWHMGRRRWGDALHDGLIQLDGPPRLARAFPSWNQLSHFAAIHPAVTPSNTSTMPPNESDGSDDRRRPTPPKSPGPSR